MLTASQFGCNFCCIFFCPPLALREGFPRNFIFAKMFDYSKDLLTNMEDRDRHHDFIEETAHIKRISSSIATMARNSSIDTLDSISRQLNQARETLNIGAAAIKNSLLDSGSTANENNPENNPDTLNEQ